jgi:hypothetical protein
MWYQLGLLGVLGAASTIDDDTKQGIVSLIALAATSALQNAYGRGMEDQADSEIAYNYPGGPKPDGPAREARRPPPTGSRSGAPAAVPAGAQALAGQE